VSGFLSRWARRKAAAARPAPQPVAPVDEAALPALDTLTGDSDITAFLAAGVSAELQSKALGIAWRDDARIAGYRGLADYDWDFNAESYGRLAAADDVAALLRRVVTPAETPRQPAATVTAPAPGRSVAQPVVEPSQMAAAEPEAPRPPARRHGGALPA
jgi:hypothetical protein